MLWPDSHLPGLDSEPIGWLTVLQHRSEEAAELVGVSAHLLPPDAIPDALGRWNWDGSHLGQAGVWRDHEGVLRFDDGLVEAEGGRAEFFVHARRHHDLASPSVEFTPSFLWFFDAIPRLDGSWCYLDRAGRDVDLVRVTQEGDLPQVEVKALELRRFLAARQRVLVIQHDLRRFSQDPCRDKADAEFRSSTMFFRFSIRPASGPEDRYRSFSRFVGKNVVLPLDIDPDPDRQPEGPFPAFIYGVDESTGEPLASTCEENKLPNYIGDRGMPHYLTPVYFRREVLSRYTQQPRKYKVEQRRLSCLDLWSLQIDINDVGLVEVYLGDLGRDLPPSERVYWQSFNVVPTGQMNEARLRQDFLGQFVDSGDPIRHLHRARHALDDAWRQVHGRPLYRLLGEEDQLQFDRLHLLTTIETAEFNHLVIVLAKGLADALDETALRAVSGIGDTTVRSLQLLAAFVDQLGGDGSALVGPLQLVQDVRSAAGAHPRGRRYEGILARAGLADLNPAQLFEHLVHRATEALIGLAELTATAARR